MCSDYKLENPTEDQLYKTYISNWYSGFKKLANDILESGKHLYVIAISRKMPRFFSWLVKREDYYGVEGLGDILDKAEYTTEHAIPFIFGKDKESEYEVIVVDDSMVYGNTMRKVADDVADFTGGKSPYISVIVSGTKVNLGLIKHKGIQTLNINTDEHVSEWMDYVSKCNAASELPVDVEFPIIHLKNCKNNTYKQHFDSHFSQDERYEINRTNTVESLNVLLDREMVELTAMDFAKLRCFLIEDEIRLVVISPLSIRQESLQDDSPFTVEKLSGIWSSIKASVINKGSYRTSNSLVVMLNYMHSLNTFRRNWDTILPEDWNHISLEFSDLMLLVGKNFAKILASEFARYLMQEYRERYTIERISLPPVFTPKSLETPYKIQRNMIVAKERNGKNVEHVLTNIFDQSRYDKSILGQNITLFHRMHSSFFESFDSLKSLIHSAFDVENLDREINKTVDSLIDAGKIIPKYIPVINSQGELYWRRYFTNAHSSIEL